MEFKPIDYEKKWIAKWEKEKIYKAVDFDNRKKSFLLIEFPYPSGERLHVGHARSYCCLDAVARKRRMQGQNVLYPIGWDAFGLPAENYAIKTGIHPSETTKKNIANAKAEAISWGLSFDWDREINTTDPDYYKWTQWIFVQLFKKGLAYKAEIAVNWCPSCKINLANEEVIDGNCERCGTATERRKQAQWMLKITAYADRLLEDLKTVNFREDIAAQQINWIGKKEGIDIIYDVVDSTEKITVFTTTPVNFGASFMVIAPEHSFAIEVSKSNLEVKKYLELIANKSERERLAEGKAKTGVFTGKYVWNHVTREKMPVWVSDFVLMSIGTGAVQGCPGHDLRDWEFAKKFGIKIPRVVSSPDGNDKDINEEPFVVHIGDRGTMINSDFLNGMDFSEAMHKTMDYFEEKGWGKRTYTYHLRDWVFSRQHYWGEPIPMVYCDKCGWNPVSEDQLPVKLPEVEKYQPTGTGESPLAHIESFVNTVCPVCGGSAKRETDTMPNWAGSSWYFLRYIDPVNQKVLADKEKLHYWMPVDWYNGGMEHTTLHLLYSRFWIKVLFDIGAVPVSEPYAKRTSHGVILGPDGRKMSKSKGNVINPDEVVAKYGADTLRLYEMFIGPFEQMVAWSWESLEGTYRFLKRVWNLVMKEDIDTQSSLSAKAKVAKLVEKIDSDLENMKFNTAVAALMEFVNWWSENWSEVGTDLVEVVLKILAPMAPFMTEELYARYTKGSIHIQKWPSLIIENFNEEIKIAVMVDGKVRGTIIQLATDAVKTEKQALELENVRKYVEGREYKVVYVPGKIINFVTAHAGK